MEAAIEAGVSYDYLLRARRRGLISGERRGWQYFFTREAVELFKMSHYSRKLLKETGVEP